MLSLRSYLAANPGLTHEQRFTLAIEICKKLYVDLHSRGKSHGNINLDSIQLNGDEVQLQPAGKQTDLLYRVPNLDARLSSLEEDVFAVLRVLYLYESFYTVAETKKLMLRNDGSIGSPVRCTKITRDAAVASCVLQDAKAGSILLNREVNNQGKVLSSDGSTSEIPSLVSLMIYFTEQLSPWNTQKAILKLGLEVARGHTRDNHKKEAIQGFIHRLEMQEANLAEINKEAAVYIQPSRTSASKLFGCYSSSYKAAEPFFDAVARLNSSPSNSSHSADDNIDVSITERNSS